MLCRHRTPRTPAPLPRPFAFLPALALLASACAHGTPEMQRAAGPSEAPAPHLRALADGTISRERTARELALPDPATIGEVSLERVFAYADRHAPVLAVARSTRSRAEAARVAAAILQPSNPEVSVAAGPRVGITGTGFDFEASVTQQLQVAGERHLRLEAAGRLRDLTDAEIELIRWSVHCDLHAAFHRALVEQQRLRLAERVVRFQQDVLRFVERRISAGEAAPLVQRLALAEVAQSEQQLVGARQAFFVSRIRLALLSGWPAATPPTPAGQVDAPRDPPPLSQLLTTAMEHLPVLRASAARIREAEARATLAERETYPRPSIGVQYRREGNPTSEGPYDIVMGVLSVPIPSFQRNQGPRAQARADVMVAEAEFNAARRLLDGQIVEARSEVVAAAERRRAYGTEILPRFEENLTLLQRSFELGEIDILALSAGRERFLRIQSDALAAQQDYFTALAGLERVVGVDLWHDAHEEESTP